MKILQINTVCGVGSTGRIAIDLYKLLEEHGHECVIAYGRGSAPKGIKTIKIGTDMDNYLHVAKTRLTDKHGFGSLKATNEFITKIKQYDPDIIHLHNIHGYYINIELLFHYLKESNKPVVWTLHDCWAITGHCAHFDYSRCEKWKTGCFNCKQKMSYPSGMVLDSSKYNYEMKKRLYSSVKNMTIVSVSKWLDSIVSKSILSSHTKKIIYNGIDVEVFKYQNNQQIASSYGIENKFIILGVASIWNKKKGLDNFLKLSKLLQNDEIIVLVGLSKKQIGNLPPNIIGIERMKNISELVDIYSLSDVFVNMSYEETFGLVTAEAMSCGTPAVVIDSTASPELVTNSCSFISKKDNLNDTYNCITQVKINGKAKYSANCIKHIKESFNKETTNNDYLNTYELLFNKSL